MCLEEAKPNRIIDLLDAHTPQKEIAKIIGVSERNVQCIQHAKRLSRGASDLLTMGATTGKETRSSLTLSWTKSWRILQSP